MWSYGTDEFNLSELTEAVVGNLAIGFHGDKRPPDVVIPEIMEKQYKCTADYLGNGFYCTRHEDENHYKYHGWLYKVYIRGVQDYLHLDFTAYNSAFPNRRVHSPALKKVDKLKSSMPPEDLAALGINVDDLAKKFDLSKKLDATTSLEDSDVFSAYPDIRENVPPYIVRQILMLRKKGLRTRDGSMLKDCIMDCMREEGVDSTSRFLYQLTQKTNITSIIPGVTYKGSGDARCILTYDWNRIVPVAYKDFTGDGENSDWIPVDFRTGEFSKYRGKIVRDFNMDNRNPNFYDSIKPKNKKQRLEARLKATADMSYDELNHQKVKRLGRRFLGSFYSKNQSMIADVEPKPMNSWDRGIRPVSVTLQMPEKALDAYEKYLNSPNEEARMFAENEIDTLASRFATLLLTHYGERHANAQVRVYFPYYRNLFIFDPNFWDGEGFLGNLKGIAQVLSNYSDKTKLELLAENGKKSMIRFSLLVNGQLASEMAEYIENASFNSIVGPTPDKPYQYAYNYEGAKGGIEAMPNLPRQLGEFKSTIMELSQSNPLLVPQKTVAPICRMVDVLARKIEELGPAVHEAVKKRLELGTPSY